MPAATLSQRYATAACWMGSTTCMWQWWSWMPSWTTWTAAWVRTADVAVAAAAPLQLSLPCSLSEQQYRVEFRLMQLHHSVAPAHARYV